MNAPIPSRHLSRRTILPRALNLLLWLSFCAMAGTGLLLAFRLPPGSRGGRGLEALGLGRHEWGDVHTWVSYIFMATIVVHLALHWRWLWQIAARKRAWPMLAGFGLGIAQLLFLALQPVHNLNRSRSETEARSLDLQNVTQRKVHPAPTSPN